MPWYLTSAFKEDKEIALAPADEQATELAGKYVLIVDGVRKYLVPIDQLEWKDNTLDDLL